VTLAQVRFRVVSSRVSFAAAAVTSVGVLGCALPQTPLPTPGVIVEGARSPMQYRSPLPHDARVLRSPPQTAHGEACVDSVTFPPSPPAVFLGSQSALQLLPWNSFEVTVGDQTYAKAMARARDSVAGAPLVDVRADARVTSVLGLWTRWCVEVHATVAER
jgi:hypothetical protein